MSLRYSEASTEAAWFHLSREAMDPNVASRFTVEGEPASKARARFNRAQGRTYTPEATLRAEAAVASAFTAATPDYAIEPDRTYGVTALFFHATRQRRDVDNMLKLILDSLNGIAWEDDSQVIEVSGRKCQEAPGDARTEVVIYRIGSTQKQTMPCEGCGQHFEIYPSSQRKFCSRECAYAQRRRADRPACEVCGAPVKDRRNRTCSMECGAIRRRNPQPRCVSCAEPVSDYRKRLCRACYLANGVGRHHVGPECSDQRHVECLACACVCHLDATENRHDIRIEDLP